LGLGSLAFVDPAYRLNSQGLREVLEVFAHTQRAENYFDLVSLKTFEPQSLYDSLSECFTSLNSNIAEQILVSATIHAAQYLYTAA